MYFGMGKSKTSIARRLTKELIAATPTPAKGEVWLADSVVEGFGVRIWCNRSGARGISYAVRVKDKRGKWVRRTINLEVMSRLRWPLIARRYDDKAAFYDALKYVRQTARDEIARIKGRRTSFERQLAQREAQRKIQLEQTCRQAFDTLIQNAKSEGRSPEYVQRLDKVFYRYIPKKLLETKLNEVSSDDLRAVFEDMSIPTSSFKILQMLAGRVFSLNYTVSRAELRIRTNEEIDYVSLASLRVSQYPIPSFLECKHLIFERFERETEHIVEATCLSLFFGAVGNGVPLTRIINAKWDEIWSSQIPAFNLPREMYWRFSTRNPLKSVAFTNEFATLVLRALQRSDGSPFWLPRNQRGQKISFTRLSRYWMIVTQELGLPSASPAQYMRNWNKTLNISDEFRSVMSGNWKPSKEWRLLHRELFVDDIHKQ